MNYWYFQWLCSIWVFGWDGSFLVHIKYQDFQSLIFVAFCDVHHHQKELICLSINSIRSICREYCGVNGGQSRGRHSATATHFSPALRYILSSCLIELCSSISLSLSLSGSFDHISPTHMAGGPQACRSWNSFQFELLHCAHTLLSLSDAKIVCRDFVPNTYKKALQVLQSVYWSLSVINHPQPSYSTQR